MSTTRQDQINAIEALEAIPGIRITSQVQGQRGAVRIDGLPPEFTEIYVNGQRYAGENDRAIDLGDQLFANIERIEIMRGPQALRHTSRAAGGVINMITKDPPSDGPAVEAMIANGDQEQVSGELTAGYGNASLGGNLVYDYNQIGGFETPDPDSQDPDNGLPSPFGKGSLYRTHDLYGTLVARPSEPLELKTRLGYRIREIPILFVDRRVGISKMSKPIVGEAFFMVWRLGWMRWFARPNRRRVPEGGA